MNPFLTVFIIFFSFGLLLLLFKKSYKSKRHQYKIKKSKKVLITLATFQGDFREARIITYLRKIDPYVFEELLLTAFEQRGFKIKRNKRYSGDGGIDGIVYNSNGKKLIIQAKRYKNSISTAHIFTFSQNIVLNNALGGYFIHTGRTPKETYSLYRGSKIIIISGNTLVELITTNKPIYELI